MKDGRVVDRGVTGDGSSVCGARGTESPAVTIKELKAAGIAAGATDFRASGRLVAVRIGRTAELSDLPSRPAGSKAR